MKCTEPENAIAASSANGPVFGGGHDLHICNNNSNASWESYSNFGRSYKHPNYTELSEINMNLTNKDSAHTVIIMFIFISFIFISYSFILISPNSHNIGSSFSVK